MKFKPGTKCRTLYQYSETVTILRKTKKRTEADVAYFGSREKADQWHLVRFDRDGKKAVIHQNMMALSNEQ